MSPYKKIRESTGTTLKELSQKTFTPVAVIKMIESGEKQPSLMFKSNFRSLFKVTDRHLEGGEE